MQSLAEESVFAQFHSSPGMELNTTGLGGVLVGPALSLLDQN